MGLRRRWARCLLAIIVPGIGAWQSAAAQGSTDRTVYRCTVAGVTIFSDRPCAPDAAVYEPDTSRTSTYTPPPIGRPAASAQPARLPTQRRRAAGGDDQVRHAAACERLRNGLRDIAARMRSGYNARQGEQLRERKTKLERQRRAQKCR